MDVKGTLIYVHMDKFGIVVEVNNKVAIDSSSAITAALKESRVPVEVHSDCSPPTLTIVHGLKDGEAHLDWTCTICYNMDGEDGYLKLFKDQIFARAAGDTPSGLIQIHPKIYDAPSLETWNFNQSTRACPIVSINPNKIAIIPIDLDN